MAEHEPIVTRTMKLTEARQHFSQVLTEVSRGQTRVLVEKSGIPIAGIVSAADLKRLNRYEEQRAERFRALEETSRAFEDVPLEELEGEVARALAAVRAKSRKRERHGIAGS